jgi:peptidyl-prolyl cis-trans isomerase B (cyclophilin B)
MIVLKTNYGPITVELDFEKAPKSAENFMQYAKAGFYDGTIFHRVIDNFMIQGWWL